MTGRDDRVPELDGLRAIAVSLVMLQHFTDPIPPSRLWHATIGPLGWSGWIGVDLFFVLSGFLITGICLDHAGPGFFRAFYARRALRILPPYFAMVAVVSLAEVVKTHHIPVGLGWLATFSANIGIAARGWSAVPVWATHLWSVAVEEQFYLLWPAFVFIVGKSLPRFAIAALCGSVSLRIGLALTSNGLGDYVLMPAHMDGLALGALLAWAIRSDAWPRVRGWFAAAGDAPLRRWIGGLVAVIYGFAITAIATGLLADPLVLILLASIGSTVLVGAAIAASPNAPLRVLLRRRFLVEIGRKSYGMYLAHVPVRAVLMAIGWRPESAPGMLLYVGSGVGLTYVAAAALWRFIEAPALAHKVSFPYVRRTVQGETSAAPASS